MTTENKKAIKEMLQHASNQSDIGYIELLNDFTTISDIASEFDLTTKQAVLITNELKEENGKEMILNAIISNDMITSLKYFNDNLKDKNDINKIDLFWIMQLKQEIDNTIHRIKAFNK